MTGNSKGATSPPESETPFSGLANRLKHVRNTLSKTQREMSDLLGVGKNSWQNYESGGQVPGSRVIAALVGQGFNANWVLAGKGPMLLAEIEALKLENAKLKRENDNFVLLELEAKKQPRPDVIVPVLGLAECGEKGWYLLKNTGMHAEAPAEITRSSGSTVIAAGSSMIPAGISPGNILFCDHQVQPQIGDAVFVRDTKDRVTVQIYCGETEREGILYVELQGWSPLDANTPDKPQQPVPLGIPKDMVKLIAPVIFVRRRV